MYFSYTPPHKSSKSWKSDFKMIDNAGILIGCSALQSLLTGKIHPFGRKKSKKYENTL